jgi:type IV secretory pathway TraG/TraD family ATPase VirD4
MPCFSLKEQDARAATVAERLRGWFESPAASSCPAETVWRDWPLYQPPAFFWWWFAYDAYARDIFVEGAYIAASGGVAAVIAAITMSVWRAREMKPRLHLLFGALGRDA